MAFCWAAATVALGFLKVGLPVRVLIGLVPVASLLLLMLFAFRYAQQQDEVMRHVTMESLTIAFSVGIAIIFLLGWMIQAGVPLHLSLMDGGYILDLCFIGGYVVAYRRYQ
jgi:hypothetical protein